MRELVVGFDLDMTLIDTRPGFAATLDALGAELGVEFPSDRLTSRLGPPLDQMLIEFLPPEQIGPAVDRFRALYPGTAVETVPALPGAAAALAAVRDLHGSVLVVTGKFTPNAQLHLDHLGLPADHLEGMVWGAGKAVPLVERGAQIYVGDHVHDVEGALAAGALSVSVLTGGCDAEELVAAGTHVLLDSLDDFPDWLSEHVLTRRLEALEAALQAHGSVLVAFSGGADSAFLLAAAVRALGPENVVAATAYSDALPDVERGPARDLAAALGVDLLTPTTREMDREGYRRNDGDRCAFCKSELLDTLTPIATERGLAAVLTGTNADDERSGFRPGIKASRDRGAATPLAEVGFTKAQIREASRRWELPTWNKPAAACLSSRIAYGVEITPARLARVERAESELRLVLGDRGNLRVRDLGVEARIEVDPDQIDQIDQQLCERVRAAGFERVSVDPLGFRSGSMNERLAEPERFRQA